MLFTSSSCGLILKKPVWLSLIMLFFRLQGSTGQITVTQTPSVVVSELNQNVTLNCSFNHSPDHRVTRVILYWYVNGPEGSDVNIYPHGSEEYKERLIVLDKEETPRNMSIILLGVTWKDCKKYQCMLSYDKAGEPERKRGQGILLLLHDSMVFDLAPRSVSSLLCSVKVSPDPTFRLTVLEDGVEVCSTQNDTQAPHAITLSLHVPLHSGRKYECQLNRSSELILSRTYFNQPQSLPEPIFLYIAILLVPFIILIIILTLYLVGDRKGYRGRGKK
ncbi:hypothetical protein AGOR_G00119450 [Albula goreensis]|uniref:Ig-like domain-containing protein n=1 Tax=Albula goreensis TaxID=1534307 RepID=A0A8T3DH86_9TELE|nr:hypothetical protein AGOR_G00119450 [Albula goreensis]